MSKIVDLETERKMRLDITTLFKNEWAFSLKNERRQRMGAYINPPNETKEEFLQREGEPLLQSPKWEDIPIGFLPVCLINNGPFTAAGIAYDNRELDAFVQPGDPRPKNWYLVEIKKLFTVSDIAIYLREDYDLD